ncbi:MAG: histidinol dehydrogenase, partial [Rhodothermales bacterium]
TSPPGDDGEPHPFVLAAAHFLGLDAIYAVGGAQAIGALAYGTQTIPRVDKIVGPGNVYVAAAKKQVYGQVDIDSIAGPSEIVVLADDGADSGFAAADLLSQAEHDPRASAVLVTTDAAFAARVRERAIEMAADLPRREIVEASLADFGACIVADTMEQAVDVVNELAPEHLELLVRDPEGVLGQVRHAGAIFLGPYSPEPVGDYFAGPNHVLPTGGTARYASALDVTDFLRRQSIVAYTRERLAKTGARIATFARAEDLEAHARAVEIRIDDR